MRKLLLTVFSVLIGSALMAQLPNIGIRVGLTTSKLSTNLSENFASENQLGFQGGAFVRVNLGKFYVQPEAIYNHRSTKLEYDVYPVVDGETQTVGARTDMKIGTIDIPVIAGFKIIKTKLLNVRVFAGPELSFATNKSLSYTYTTDNGEDFTGEVPEDSKLSLDDFNNTTWYLQAGAGVDVLFLTFDLRYEKGLNEIFNGNVGDIQNVDLKNNVWVFTLGFKFL